MPSRHLLGPSTSAHDAQPATPARPSDGGLAERVLQRKIARRVLQRRAAEAQAEQAAAVTSSGAGAALPGGVQRKMEGAFQHDFSSVRVHEGGQAPAMGAEAFTRGTDIHFAPGRYEPHSPQGQELIGHELAHVVQQSQGRVAATTQAKGAPVNDDPALEREADEMGARAARGEPAREAGVEGGAAPAATGALQMRKLKDEDRRQLWSSIYKNVRATNFKLALFAVEARVNQHEMDQEDVDDASNLDEGLAFRAVQDAHTRLDDKHVDPSVDFAQNWKTEVLKLKDKADAPVKEGEGEDQVPESKTKEGYEVLVDKPGKLRVQVPRDVAGGVQLLPLDSIRWSQSDVKASTQEGASLTDVIEHMVGGGWLGPPASVVNMTARMSIMGVSVESGVEPGYTSQDNRRLLAAMTAGLPMVPCAVKAANDPLPETWKVEDRDAAKKTIYYDEHEKQIRVGASGDGFKNGKPTKGSEDRFRVLMQKGYVATTYGELIFIRSANQPKVEATGQEFEVGGSSEAPYYKDKK